MPMSAPVDRDHDGRRLVLVTYDVPCNRRRRKLAKVIDDFGGRVQLSVFEARLSPDQVERLLRAIHWVIEDEQDKVLVYTACRRCEAATHRFGPMEAVEIPAFFLH